MIIASIVISIAAIAASCLSAYYARAARIAAQQSAAIRSARRTDQPIPVLFGVDGKLSPEQVGQLGIAVRKAIRRGYRDATHQ